ncbi:MAG: ATP-binding protein [Candidatus Methanoplasma sp.]|jgi:predicted AAA+ superfamily ATPase|nr:ATP-binding protein [Candidatus Methanoplasma sp.]
MEKEVVRHTYISCLSVGRDRTHTVKIITGVRRCGKSTLMKQYARALVDSGVDEGRVILINFESMEYGHIRTYGDLVNQIDGMVPRNERSYILLDELQRIPEWERAVNALMVDFDVDIYITGSNAHLLSSELATYMSGRYVQIRMLPLSFREYLDMHPADAENNVESRFHDYVWKGSLPMVDPSADETFVHDQLKGVFDTVLVRDVLTHTDAKDSRTLINVARFVMSNIGCVTSSNNIAKTYLADEHGEVNNKTVGRYLQALEEAYVIYKAERYDIRGKKLLQTLEKYYVADTGMRNAVVGISSKEDDSRQIENIVYLELIRRGYEVAVGKYGDREVDFTARKGAETEYYQVTKTMIDECTYDREVSSLSEIRDSYSKTVLSMDSFVYNVPGGIKHKNVIKWLLEGQ